MSPGDNGSHSRAKEWKLDGLVDLLEDVSKTSEGTEAPLVIVYCNSIDSVESVSYKLVSHGIDALALVSFSC